MQRALERSLILVGCTLSLASPAMANVELDVDVSAPFTEQDLHQAVELRHATEGNPDVVIRVAKLDYHRYVVTVDDRSQLVELESRDHDASTRVVALVVVSMLMEQNRDLRSADDELPPLVEESVERGAPGHLSLHISGSYTRDDNGYYIPFLNGGASYALTPHARLVATVGIGRYDGYLDTSSVILPIRLGVGGRAGAVGIEMGGELLKYREDSCGGSEWGSAKGVYGAAKVFVPLGRSKRLVGELGGRFALANNPTDCNSAMNYTKYGGWIGVGMEWRP